MNSNQSSPDKPETSLPTAYFDRLYEQATDGDPWQFRQSSYEAAKYQATLDQLPRAVYHLALEVGCSIGVLTRRLAERVQQLLSIDIAEAALAQARCHCADQSNVRFVRIDLLESIPAGPFDLILLSEVAYYWTPEDFDRVFRALASGLEIGGQIMMVHWRAAVPDYPQTGDAVHDQASRLSSLLGLEHRASRAQAEYRIDLWERSGQAGSALSR